MSNRIHRVTHPVLGIVTWREIQAAQVRLRKERGRGVCSWCHGDVPPRCSSCCQSAECLQRIRWACSWSSLRAYVLRQAGGKCAKCHRQPLEVDHIKPVCEGGTDDLDNLRGLCVRCHQAETAALAKRRAQRRRGERSGQQIGMELR